MITLLRTLTLKSALKYGKWHDQTVGQMINLRRQDYLIWMYYNSFKISFTDDILDAIGIGKNDRIEKPGVDKRLGLEVGLRYVNPDKRMKDYAKNAKISSVQKLKALKKDGKYTRVGLARYNRGHR